MCINCYILKNKSLPFIVRNNSCYNYYDSLMCQKMFIYVYENLGFNCHII